LFFVVVSGFYISTYKTSSGATKKIASTKFESSYARQAFPCFDEPAFKANFSIAITTEAYHKTILSNMPNTTAPVVVDASGTWQRVAFDTTPRMSTYLVAYVICDFAYVEALTARGVPVRVWTDVEKISFTAAALKAGVDSLNRYEQFFKLPYPLPKSDQVAIPDFASGAMEVQTTHARLHMHPIRTAALYCGLSSLCVCLSLLCPSELGIGHLPRNFAAGVRRFARGELGADGCQDRRTRVGTPVVRGYCHHGVVGWSVDYALLHTCQRAQRWVWFVSGLSSHSRSSFFIF
jgi:hypothetical protein